MLRRWTSLAMHPTRPLRGAQPLALWTHQPRMAMMATTSRLALFRQRTAAAGQQSSSDTRSGSSASSSDAHSSSAERSSSRPRYDGNTNNNRASSPSSSPMDRMRKSSFGDRQRDREQRRTQRSSRREEDTEDDGEYSDDGNSDARLLRGPKLLTTPARGRLRDSQRTVTSIGTTTWTGGQRHGDTPTPGASAPASRTTTDADADSKQQSTPSDTSSASSSSSPPATTKKPRDRALARRDAAHGWAPHITSRLNRRHNDDARGQPHKPYRQPTATITTRVPGQNYYSFNDLRVPSHIWPKLRRLGYKQPTAIQVAALPVLLQHANSKPAGEEEKRSNSKDDQKDGKKAIKPMDLVNDVLIEDITGCGKTLSYVLPLLATVDNRANHLQAVIIVPTRELGVQVTQVIREINVGGSKDRKRNPTRVERLVGEPTPDMVQNLRNNPPHIAIGTAHLLSQLLTGPIEVRAFDADRLKWLVVDEVDHVLKPHTSPHLLRILDRTHAGARNKTERRTRAVFVTASLDYRCHDVAAKYMHQPTLVAGKRDGKHTHIGLPANTKYYSIDYNDAQEKEHYIAKIMTMLGKKGRAMLFINDSTKLKELAQVAINNGITVAALVPDSNKEERHTALDDIRDGRVRLLFCTDMAARGLDIPGLNCVINWDVPKSRTSFLHRAGRVNRVGGTTDCTVISLVSNKNDDVATVARYATLLKIDITATRITKEGKLIAPPVPSPAVAVDGSETATATPASTSTTTSDIPSSVAGDAAPAETSATTDASSTPTPAPSTTTVNATVAA